MNCRMQAVRVIQMIRVFLNAILFKMNLKRLRIWKTFRNADKDEGAKYLAGKWLKLSELFEFSKLFKLFEFLELTKLSELFKLFKEFELFE